MKTKFVINLRNWFNKQLEVLSFRQKFVFAFLILFLPVFLYIYWYFLPKYRKMQDLKEDIIRLKMEINKYKKMATQKEILEKQLHQREVFFKKLVVTLPSEKEIPELLSNVSEQAKLSGLEVISFTPQNEIAKDYYNIIPFKIEVKGSFQELILFLDRVESLPRIIVLNHLSIKMKEEKRTIYLYTQCDFYTYRYTGQIVGDRSKKQ